ncbi:MAG: hypothetical protein ACLFN8_03975 [Candidatus Woesearchaeota archaeon]
MSITKKITTYTAALIIGGAIGYTTTQLNKPRYELKEQNNKTYLHSNTLKKNEEIHTQNNTFMLGDIEHTIQGIQEISHLEGLITQEHINQKEQQETQDKRRTITYSW